MDFNKLTPKDLPDHLNPERTPAARLVVLPPTLNPYADELPIYFSVGSSLPLGDIKIIPAFGMLQNAWQRGQLASVTTLVESSSGNFVHALALLAPYFGITRVVAVVPADLPESKRTRLEKISWVELHRVTEGSDLPTAVAIADRLGSQPHWHHLNQYANPANPVAHARWTSGPIDRAIGPLSVIAAGLGTTGTLTGARHFHNSTPRPALVGAVLAPNNAVPGVRTRERLGIVKFKWQTGIISVEVTAYESYALSQRLTLAGIDAGPSSGFALAGLYQFLASQRSNQAAWERLKTAGPAVCIGGDGSAPYRDKYSTVLEAIDYAPPLTAIFTPR